MSQEISAEELTRLGIGRRRDAGNTADIPLKPMSEASMERMAQQRDEINAGVSDAVKEIERLRLRQDQLEKERNELEELRRKQEEYQSLKKEMMNKFSKSIMLLEKEESRAVRAMEMMSAMRTQFRETLEEITGIHEEAWSDENYPAELNKAMVIIDDARSTYKKGTARIEAGGWNRDMTQGILPSIVTENVNTCRDRGFAYWLKVGFAASLPLIIFLICLFVAWLFVRGY